MLQIEMEGQYAIQKEGKTKQVAWSIPSLLFRYGLSNAVELQLNAPLIREHLYENDHLIHSLNKFDHVQLGLSVNLWKQKNILPAAAIMGRIILPFENNLKINTLGKIVSLNFSNTINEHFSLNYNIGYAYETDATKSGYYIANLSYNLNSKIHFFLENFADFNKEMIVSQNLNLGGGYNIKNNLSIDYSIAKGLNHNLFYTSLLVTWQINTQKK
ncbi:hypothetical protein EC396_04950 [Lutibacter sp. HS1-25]|nr:hypothetical protein EC396_04950 [Lutibacter sp. HS1-25]